jgi:ABC-type branched-subunit amino acid transport system ATPase component
MTEQTAVLDINGVSSGYGKALVVRNVSLTVGVGEIVALLGKNGMGKSTLLRTVMGYLPVQSGCIAYRGEDVTEESPDRMARHGISYGPQDQAIFQDLTVRENLLLGMDDASDFAKEFARICEFFPFMENRLKQRAGTLSGGEQKMLILARSLIAKPKLILLDEITEGLQPSVIDSLECALIEERNRSGTSILLVEQHIQFALRVADRWAVLKLGEINDAGESSLDGAASCISDHLAV